MDNTNCVVKIVNRSKCDCSEDLVSLNKVKFNDKLVVLTSCGLLPGRDVPSYDYCICTTHLNLIMKDVETKKRRSLCLVPAALSAHPDVDNTIISIDTLKILQKRKADRTMNADSVDIVRERTGFVLPVGTREYIYLYEIKL